MRVEDLKANVQARKAVEDLLTFVPDVCMSGAGEDRFWELLAEYAAGKCGRMLEDDSPKNRPMEEAEAFQFSSKKIGFGQFENQRIRDIKPTYLEFLLKDEFRKELRRYVRSTYYKKLNGMTPVTLIQ